MEYDILLLTRKSIRKYKDQEIKQEDIETCIKAALEAPTWKNTETERFYVALSEEAKAKVYAALPEHNQKKTVHAAYIVCTYVSGVSGIGKETFANELGDGWGAYDNGLASMCLMLKASELGLGTLVMGMRDADELRKAFSIPENEIITGVIAIGVPNEDPARRTRKSVTETSQFF